MQHRVDTAARSGHAIARRSLLTALPFLPAAVVFPVRHAEASELRGRVVTVTDGDSLAMVTERFGQLRIRLAEIDAPESDQPYGDIAAQVLAQLVLQRKRLPTTAASLP